MLANGGVQYVKTLRFRYCTHYLFAVPLRRDLKRKTMQVKKDYTREQIVEFVKRVFLKNGYAKTSMRDIALVLPLICGQRQGGSDSALPRCWGSSWLLLLPLRWALWQYASLLQR